ncbi:3-mercaptopyruvate sulfurtransferase-like [Acanthaster planci]|uniref:Sulfurtransferase n=1 Tax=Acanthaster planci TaxID=133434 RepID=A0A8B7XK18_ACAPL|nr:3-mercaptopyruvate sulfurtransferase-like [Acanthaster planci]
MQKVSTLVSVGWVAKQINSKAKNFCILDASWHLPMVKRDPLKEYREAHIPSALFFDIEKCSAYGGAGNLSLTLPSPDEFAKYVGTLGIDNDTHVVVYENNAKFGVFSAPRAWWMFRMFGHNIVSVMEGGLPLWTKEGHETTDVIPEVDRVQFRASYMQNLLKSFSDIEANLEAETFKVMDARAKGRFTGDMPEPREGIESGHIPNSISLPFQAMLQEEDGIKKFKLPDALREAFADAGLDLGQPITASCGSGISACILAMGAYLAGTEDVAVFDGSWEEFYLKMKDTKPENILKG